MRRITTLVALACAWALSALPALAQAQAQTATPAPAPTQALPRATAAGQPPVHETVVKLSADHVAFYYDRFLVEADGHVRLTTSDGFSVTGDAFSMDLKLNRFLIAGNAVLTMHGVTVKGAAVSDFLDFRRLYFVPVTTEPDRWTFLNEDLTHPIKGRVMPGDVFDFPDLPQTPSFIARSATIGSRLYVRLEGASALLAGVPVPLGVYVVNFSPNPYFAQNSLSGANFDATWNFAGNSNSISALHFRDDSTNGVYLGFEQHFVGAHDYAIFSISPFTKAAKWFNLQMYEKLGSRFQVQTFTQFYEYQQNFIPPYAAQQTTYVNAIYAFPHSYLQSTANLTNYNLLGPGSLEPGHDPVGAGSLSHPTSDQLTWTSFQNKIGPLPLFEQTYVGYGFNHDSVGAQYLQPIPVTGLQTYGAPCVPQPKFITVVVYCPAYTTIWNTVYGFNVFTPSVKFGDRDDPYHTFYLSASFNAQRTYNSLPHHLNSQTTTFSLSRTFARPLSAYLSYQIQNTGDYYKFGGYQNCNPNPPNPLCPPSLAAFDGAATLRTLSTDWNFAPNPEFNVSVLLRKHDDFPRPNSVFAAPTTNVLGFPLYSTYLGQPPWDITPDVRFRLLPHMLLDLSKTYYFKTAGPQGWQPGFVVQVLPYQ